MTSLKRPDLVEKTKFQKNSYTIWKLRFWRQKHHFQFFYPLLEDEFWSHQQAWSNRQRGNRPRNQPIEHIESVNDRRHRSRRFSNLHRQGNKWPRREYHEGDMRKHLKFFISNIQTTVWLKKIPTRPHWYLAKFGRRSGLTLPLFTLSNDFNTASQYMPTHNNGIDL